MFALDTNTLIYFFKGQGRVAERLLDTAPSEIGVPTVSIFEIETGIAKSQRPEKRRDQFDQLLTLIHILPLNRSGASHAALVRASLERVGKSIGPLDMLIAGTALAHNATLVTRNRRELERVPDLVVVDWFD